MAFSSDEVNLLVYRYLEESGFRHSAFTFGYECNVLNAGIDGTIVPRGALLSLLQKAVLFSEAEAFALLNDGELEARFEKAIGSLNILECTMCDATKVKVLQRRAQQRTAAPGDDQQQQQGSRVPSRAPQDVGVAPSTSHATPATTTMATTAANNNNFTLQGASLARPESSSSAKSTLSSAGSRENRDQQQQHGGRGAQQQQQLNSVQSNANILQQQQQQQRGAGGATATYRTTSVDYGAKLGCIPQATTSAGTIPSSNHLHPHPSMQFYHQLAQSISNHHSPSLSDGISSPYSSIASNVVSNGVLNGPTQQQQLAPTMAAFSSLGNLHSHHPLSGHPLKPGETAASISDLTARYIANGTGGGGAPGAAAYHLSPGAGKQTKGLGNS